MLILLAVLHFRSPFLQVSSVRDDKIHTFITDAQTKQTFDAQKFWQLRDQLGAVVTYNPDYLNPQSIFEFREIPEKSVQLFEYTAPELHSTESLILPSERESFVPSNEEGRIVYQDSHVVVGADQETNTLSIWQVYPFEEMKNNNGMIDYRELHQDLSNRLWVTQTNITVSPDFDFETL